MSKKRIVITGLGLISSIGNGYQENLNSLKEAKSGIDRCPQFAGTNIPISLAGQVKGFHFPTVDYNDWEFPEGIEFRRDQLRGMGPNVVFGFCSMEEAIKDAGLIDSMVSHERTSLMCASTGSVAMQYDVLQTIHSRGVRYVSPMCICYGIAGSLNINLAALFKIKGGTLGFSSACASSAHSLGTAYDLIALGRQDIVFVTGAEEVSLEAIVPFAAARTLSLKDDPDVSPCAFDKKRDGFVACEGGVTLVLEELEHAQARKAKIYAEVLGWGQSSDGHSLVIPQPEGEGLARSIKLALNESGITPDDVDYVNAHATSTLAGDEAEIHAMRSVFKKEKMPYMSSTKSLTGHGLHLAGALEAAFSCMAIHEGFVPTSANITELDPKFNDIPIVSQPIDCEPNIVMSNSSAFGGTNVSLVFKKFAE
ncbi:MAG: beta-ketoacyl-[acyl-carrier-protein] synthase family protein [Verrucomicrobiota bacterium]